MKLKSKCRNAVFYFLSLAAVSNAQKIEIVGYFPEWGMKDNRYNVKNIEASGSADKLTVINYAFCEPHKDSSGKIIPTFAYPDFAYQKKCSAEYSVDGVADDSLQALRGNLNQLKKLKKLHPKLKILISIGGWGGSAYFSDAALTDDSREFFVDTCINMFIRGNLPIINGAGGKGAAANIFDGFDIDWEFPISGGDSGNHNSPNDRDNLSQLIKLFRKKLDEINPRLMLTAALPAQEVNAKNFNVSKDYKYLNWITLMTYDLYGGWDKVTGHHTNLFTSSKEPLVHPSKYSLDKTVKLFHDKYGVSYNKLIPGVAFYGRGWMDVDSINCGLYQKGTVNGDGFENYRDLIQLEKEGYKTCFDKSALASWLYNPQKKMFWSYDNPQSVILKTLYSKAHHLRGIMFWELSGDDDKGTLLNSIYTTKMPGAAVKSFVKQNKKKNIVITRPAKGDYYLEGSDLIINSKVDNEDISNNTIEFFVDNKSIGKVLNGSPNWAWFNTPQGQHTIKAVTIDSFGIDAESAPVKFNVVKMKKYSKLWQSGKAYQHGEQIIYDGKVFICAKTHKNSSGANYPDSSNVFWKLLNNAE
jgi:chitinase